MTRSDSPRPIPGGVRHVATSGLTDATAAHGSPPTVISFSVAASPRFFPVMVSSVPPPGDPDAGSTENSTGQAGSLHFGLSTTCGTYACAGAPSRLTRNSAPSPSPSPPPPAPSPPGAPPPPDPRCRRTRTRLALFSDGRLPLSVLRNTNGSVKLASSRSGTCSRRSWAPAPPAPGRRGFARRIRARPPARASGPPSRPAPPGPAQPARPRPPVHRRRRRQRQRQRPPPRGGRRWPGCRPGLARGGVAGLAPACGRGGAGGEGAGGGAGAGWRSSALREEQPRQLFCQLLLLLSSARQPGCCSLLARPFRRLPVFARLGAGAW